MYAWRRFGAVLLEALGVLHVSQFPVFKEKVHDVRIMLPGEDAQDNIPPCHVCGDLGEVPVRAGGRSWGSE